MNKNFFLPLSGTSQESLKKGLESFLLPYEASKKSIFSLFSEFAEDLESYSLSFSPTLFKRKKAHYQFTKFISNICDQIESSQNLPKGLFRFLKSSASNELPSKKSHHKTPSSEEILPLFPLPSNKEQLESLKQLQEEDALIIKGLPGTGKSQTAANLACHFISQGQKVLVTSESSSSIKGLLKKMPKEILPLIFQDTTPSTFTKNKSNLSLEKSLFSILKKNQNISLSSLEHKIQNLSDSLKKCREQIKKTWSDLNHSKESENIIHHNKFGVYNGTLSTNC